MNPPPPSSDVPPAPVAESAAASVPVNAPAPVPAVDPPADNSQPVPEETQQPPATPPAPTAEPLTAEQQRILELEAKLAEAEKQLNTPAVAVASASVPPAKGPDGDKDPAYMRWLAENSPAEFVAKYETRGGSLVQELLAQARACLTK